MHTHVCRHEEINSIHTPSYTHSHMHTHTHTCIRTHTHAYAHSHMHKHTDTNTTHTTHTPHTHTQTPTHTHTQSAAWLFVLRYVGRCDGVYMSVLHEGVVSETARAIAAAIVSTASGLCIAVSVGLQVVSDDGFVVAIVCVCVW